MPARGRGHDHGAVGLTGSCGGDLGRLVCGSDVGTRSRRGARCRPRRPSTSPRPPPMPATVRAAATAASTSRPSRQPSVVIPSELPVAPQVERQDGRPAADWRSATSSTAGSSLLLQNPCTIDHRLVGGARCRVAPTTGRRGARRRRSRARGRSWVPPPGEAGQAPAGVGHHHGAEGADLARGRCQALDPGRDRSAAASSIQGVQDRDVQAAAGRGVGPGRRRRTAPRCGRGRRRR